MLPTILEIIFRKVSIAICSKNPLTHFHLFLFPHAEDLHNGFHRTPLVRLPVVGQASRRGPDRRRRRQRRRRLHQRADVCPARPLLPPLPPGSDARREAAAQQGAAQVPQERRQGRLRRGLHGRHEAGGRAVPGAAEDGAQRRAVRGVGEARRGERDVPGEGGRDQPGEHVRGPGALHPRRVPQSQEVLLLQDAAVRRFPKRLTRT